MENRTKSFKEGYKQCLQDVEELINKRIDIKSTIKNSIDTLNDIISFIHENKYEQESDLIEFFLEQLKNIINREED